MYNLITTPRMNKNTYHHAKDLNDESSSSSSHTTLTQSSSDDSSHYNMRRSTENTSRRPRRRGNNRSHKNSGGHATCPTSVYVPRTVRSSTSKKRHDAPMKRKDMYFSVDCEMVGIGPEGLDSALARVSIVNYENEIVLDTYVKVAEPVTDYRTFVSGIKPEHIESSSAMEIQRVRSLAENILMGKILIGHGLENDLKVMGITHPWTDIRDTTKYAPFMREILKENDEKILCPRKLKDLVREKLGKEIQVMGESHSPVEDAIAAMDLYKSIRPEWEVHMMKEVNKVTQDVPLQTRIEQTMPRDHREPVEPLRQRNFGGGRVAVDVGNHQYPYHYQYQHQPINHHHSPMMHAPQYVMPYHRPAPLTPPHQTSQYKTQLARARVVAALHQQRMKWQEQHSGASIHAQSFHPTSYFHQQSIHYVEQRMSM